MGGGESRGQGEGTNVEVTRTSVGETPVRHKIPLGIVIFLVCHGFLLSINIWMLPI